MAKITKTIRVDETLWKEVKVYVAQNDMDISSFMELAIKKELKKK